MKLHILKRTSPKGGDFVGYCVLCEKTGLTFENVKHDECSPVPNAVSSEEAIIEIIKENTHEANT